MNFVSLRFIFLTILTYLQSRVIYYVKPSENNDIINNFLKSSLKNLVKNNMEKNETFSITLNREKSKIIDDTKYQRVMNSLETELYYLVLWQLMNKSSTQKTVINSLGDYICSIHGQKLFDSSTNSCIQ